MSFNSYLNHFSSKRVYNTTFNLFKQFIINNAARQDVALLKEETSAKVQDIFQVNFSSIAEMYAQIGLSGVGVESILNISSIEARSARPGHAIYGASKAALESLTRSAAAEMAPIRSNALRLGLIEREGIREAWPIGVDAWEKSAPLARMGTLKDVLRAADYLLAATWLTGSRPRPAMNHPRKTIMPISSGSTPK